MSMEERAGYIWMNGELLPWASARVHVLSHTLHHGMGVFEGVRSYDLGNGEGAIFRLHDHTRRLFRSAHILRMTIPFEPSQIDEAQISVVKANNLVECYIRPIAFLGGEAVGVSAKGNRVHVAIAAWPWTNYVGALARQTGLRVKTSSFSRHHVNSVTIHAKACGHYINSMLANKEATDQGFDEALMLDVQGYAAEGSTENLFVVRDGVIHTPETANVLEGITRDTIMVLAGERGLRVVERRIARDEIYGADEAFYTGTAVEIVPICELDDRKIGMGIPGPITQLLSEAYFVAVRGQDPTHRTWLVSLTEAGAA